MPDIVEIEDDETISFEEFLHLFKDLNLPRNKSECMLQSASIFKKLSNNKTFLPDLILSDLAQNCASQSESNYTAQIFMLGRISSHYHMRANIWPSRQDSILEDSGEDLFAYELPHDHNFSFLTTNYWGPGYESDFYEYGSPPVGFAGEEVDLRFIGRRQLKSGQIALYRAHIDIHRQLPPPSLSITLNIMEGSPETMFKKQLIFDRSCSMVSKVTSHNSSPALFDLCASLSGERAADILMYISRNHPDDLIRFQALKAAGLATGSTNEAARLMNSALVDAPFGLSGWVRAYLAELDTL